MKALRSGSIPHRRTEPVPGKSPDGQEPYRSPTGPRASIRRCGDSGSRSHSGCPRSDGRNAYLRIRSTHTSTWRYGHRQGHDDKEGVVRAECRAWPRADPLSDVRARRFDGDCVGFRAAGSDLVHRERNNVHESRASERPDAAKQRGKAAECRMNRTRGSDGRYRQVGDSDAPRVPRRMVKADLAPRVLSRRQN